MFLLSFEEILTSTSAGMILGSQRHKSRADRVVPYQTPIVRIQQTFAKPSQTLQFVGGVEKRAQDRVENDVAQIAIAQRCQGNGFFSMQPSPPPMTRRIEPDLCEPAIQQTIAAVLQALKILPHLLTAPARIAG